MTTVPDSPDFWYHNGCPYFLVNVLLSSSLYSAVPQQYITISGSMDCHLLFHTVAIPCRPKINESQQNSYSINNNLSLLIQNSGELANEVNNNDNQWFKACIDFQIPQISLITSEKLVPQMLNLDIDEIGVNFSKGCYPGQEVVARLHYLGKAKRRLFSFKCESEMQIGDSLYCSSSKAAKARGDRYKGSGIVVNRVKFNTLFYCLATLDVDLMDSKISLNNKYGPILIRINNE